MCKILEWWILLKRVTEGWKVPRSAQQQRLEMALPAHGALALPPPGTRLRFCLLQTPAKEKTPSLASSNLSQEGCRTMLFLVLFQPDIDKLNAWSPARLCSKTPPLSLRNCFISAPTFPQPPAQPRAVGACTRWGCSSSPLHSPAPSSSTRCSA